MKGTNYMQKKSKLTSLDLAYIGMFIALMAICSWISIPMAIPITLQTFAVFTTIFLLGRKRALIAIAGYILLGLLGVPVYSNFGAGIGVLLGQTGGYMVSFLLVALVTGGIIDKFGKKLPVLMFASGVGLLLCYLLGSAWFVYIYGRANGEIGLVAALTMCVFPYVIPDMIKISLAIVLERRLARFIH